MIAIDDTLISDEVFEKKFLCDLKSCKGMCCVEGESGAPLEEEELNLLESVIDAVKPYMRKEGLEVIENSELFSIDADGDYVTPLVNNEECVYVYFEEDGTAKCAIEKAYLENETDWKKPISCHLYPVRLTKLKDFIAVNYHTWDLCNPACKLGEELAVSVVDFLKEPLIRKFGEAWYDKLKEAEKYYRRREK